MLTVKFVPNLLSGEGRQSKEVPYWPEFKLEDYLKASGFEYSNCQIMTNRQSSPQMDCIMHDHDEIIIVSRIGEGAFWAAVWVVCVWVFWATVVLSLAYSIYTYCTFKKPSNPSYGKTGDGIDESSPTYGWDGTQTIQSVGVPIPVIYGEHAVGGNRINEFVWTNGDKNYLNTLLAICEGEIESISGLKINENEAANFDEVTVDYRYGTNDQATIPNFSDLHDINSVAASLTYNNSYTYTTVLTDVEAFEVRISFPMGLFQQSESDGAILSWSVSLLVEYKLSAASIWTTAGTIDVNDKSRSALRRVFRQVGLTAGKYDIRVTRTSADGDFYHTGDTLLDYVDEIRMDDLAYPNMALVGIKTLATDQLSGTSPNYQVVVKGRKVNIPKILTALGGAEVDWEDYYWDPDANAWKLFSDGSTLYWDGVTYVNKWSANPIWCVRDLLTNTRYGLGNFIEEGDLDAASNLEMAKYCEERVDDGDGGYEKRFRLDVVLDSSGRSLDTVSQLCSSFRGVIVYSGGKLRIKIDKPETATQLFGMGNIIKDSYQESFKSLKEVANLIELTYMDKSKGWFDDMITVLDPLNLPSATNPPRKKSVRIFSTKPSYVIREGNYLLRSSRAINRSLVFKVGIDAIACQAFDVISFSHDVPQVGFSGRILTGSTVSSINIDRTVTIEAGKTYRIRTRSASDVIEERDVTNVPGDTAIITVSSPFSNAPAEFDVYAFGEDSVEKKDYRIIGFAKQPDYTVQITAVEYEPTLYTDDAVVIPSFNYSSLSGEAPPVTDLSLTEAMVKLKDGTIENVIDVWFRKPSFAGVYVGSYGKARIYVSDDDGDSWLFRGESVGTHFQVIGNIVDLHNYIVRVVSVTSTGREGSLTSAPSSSISIVGKSAPPSDVTSFIVTQDRDRLTMGWSLVSDVDVLGYEIRLGADWLSGSVVAFVQGNTYITTDILVGASQSYWIKAVDTSGNYSTNAKECVITVASIPYRNVITSYSEDSAWAADKSGHEDAVCRVTIYKSTTNTLVCKLTVS